jgi:hypothetical protein
LHPISSVLLLLTTLLIGDVSGQQPKRPLEPPPAPLLPAEQAWVRELRSLPAAAGVLDGDRVYIPLQEGGTLSLARETGEPEWTNPLGTPWPLALAPASLIVVTTDEVAALDRRTGTMRWRVPLPARSLAPVAITPNLALVATDNGALTAFRIPDGSLAWSLPIEGLAAPVSLAADAEAVYITMKDGQVAAVALDAGRLTWRVTLEGALSPPVVARNRVFIGSTSNVFYALDAQTGEEKWKWLPTMIGGDVIGSAVDGSVAFFAGLDNVLHAVNRDNGNQRWKQPTPTRPIAPPQAFGGIVAVFGISPAIATFNAKTGAPLGTYVIPTVTGATTAPIPKGPPIIDPDLRPFRVAFVVVTSDGRAIGLRPAGMMFRDPPTVPITELPGKTLARERLPTAVTRP